jgi:hypothetical protein
MKIAWRYPERLTLHVEPDALRGLVAQGKKVLRWHVEPLPADTIQSNAVARPEALARVVTQMREVLEVGTREVAFAFPHARAIQRVLTLPELPEKLRDEAVRREARREFPLPLAELYFTWTPLTATGQLRIFAVGIPRTAVESYVAALHKAKIRPHAMDIKTLTLARAVNHENVIILDVEPGGCRIFFIHNFVPCIARSVSLPQQGDPSAQATHMMGEIQRVLDFCESNDMASPHASPRLCLTGTSDRRIRLADLLAKRWTVVEPNVPLDLPERFPLYAYLSNIGLVLKEI